MSNSVSAALPVPVRVNNSDDPAEILRFALNAWVAVEPLSRRWLKSEAEQHAPLVRISPFHLTGIIADTCLVAALRLRLRPKP